MNMAAFWGAFFGLIVYDILKALWKNHREIRPTDYCSWGERNAD